MKQNLTSTQERGNNIDDLQAQSTNLKFRSNQFKDSARSVKRKMCLSNMKWWIILGGVAIVVIIIAIAVGEFWLNPNSETGTNVNQIFSGVSKAGHK